MPRRCNAVVIYSHPNYDRYVLTYLTIRTVKGDVISISYDWNCSKEFATHDAMYKFVIDVIKHNGYYCKYFTDFGTNWYDILWVNTSKVPVTASVYAYKEVTTNV